MKNAKQKILFISAALILAAILTASAGCIDDDYDNAIVGTWESLGYVNYEDDIVGEGDYYVKLEFLGDHSGTETWYYPSGSIYESYGVTWNDDGSGHYTMFYDDYYDSERFLLRGNVITDSYDYIYIKKPSNVLVNGNNIVGRWQSTDPIESIIDGYYYYVEEIFFEDNSGIELWYSNGYVYSSSEFTWKDGGFGHYTIMYKDDYNTETYTLTGNVLTDSYDYVYTKGNKPTVAQPISSTANILGKWMSDDLIYDEYTDRYCYLYYYFYNDNTGKQVWSSNYDSYKFTWVNKGSGHYKVDYYDYYSYDIFSMNGNILTDGYGYTYHKV